MVGDMDFAMGLPIGLPIGLCIGPVQVGCFGYSAKLHTSSVPFPYIPKFGCLQFTQCWTAEIQNIHVGDKFTELCLLTYTLHPEIPNTLVH